MLFLLRPRQTWMPYSLPRNRMQQSQYNLTLQQQFDATRRVPPSAPTPPDPLAQVKELAALHAAGTLTDDEFAAAKAKVLGLGTGAA